MSDKLRLDKWLWYARFFKSRSLATDVCRSRKVRINGVHSKKASATIVVGDVLTFPQADAVKVVEITALGERRGPASEAALLYKDLTPAPTASAPVETEAVSPTRDKGMGRPTKYDRRALDRLRDQD